MVRFSQVLSNLGPGAGNGRPANVSISLGSEPLTIELPRQAMHLKRNNYTSMMDWSLLIVQEARVKVSQIGVRLSASNLSRPRKLRWKRIQCFSGNGKEQGKDV
jgi:hypothetical protein